MDGHPQEIAKDQAGNGAIQIRRFLYDVYSNHRGTRRQQCHVYDYLFSIGNIRPTLTGMKFKIPDNHYAQQDKEPGL